MQLWIRNYTKKELSPDQQTKNSYIPSKKYKRQEKLHPNQHSPIMKLTPKPDQIRTSTHDTHAQMLASVHYPSAIVITNPFPIPKQSIMTDLNRSIPPALEPPANAHNAAAVPITAHSAATASLIVGKPANVKHENNDDDGDDCTEITPSPRVPPSNYHNLPTKYLQTHIITTTSKLSKYAKKSNFYKLPTLIHNNRDLENLEQNTLIPEFSQLDLIERIKAIGFSHQLAIDNDGLLCVVALSSDTVPTALLYPDANGNFNYRALPQCPFSLAIKAEFKANALRVGIEWVSLALPYRYRHLLPPLTTKLFYG
jgi:hypothetical protein